MYNFLFVKEGGKYSQLFFSDIQYIEATDKYARVVTVKKSYLIQDSLCTIEKSLPDCLFCRIHRSYIVSLLHLANFDNTVAQVGGKKLPIGKHYKGILQKKVFVLGDDLISSTKVSTYDISRLMQSLKPN